jgi:DNA adenine methylase (dam)
MEKIKTALRYPGGKSRALNQITPMFPSKYKEYREPFIGGGSVFINTIQKEENKNKKYWINDLNYDLYCFWNQVKKNNSELIQELQIQKRKTKSGKILYYKLKEKPEEEDEFHRAMRFFILNRITFSGLAECGGYSNESFEKRFTETSIQRLEPLSNLLKNVKITNCDYSELLTTNFQKDVFVFLDPPYLNVKKSKLYGKNGDLHLNFEHERFAETVKSCKCKWLITCDDSPEIRELFDFANIQEWELQYGVNNRKDNNKAKKGKELFISSYKI